MDQHIYEDPDAMDTPAVYANTMVPIDYRENFAVSSGSQIRAPCQQEDPTKSSKKWNLKLRVKKNKQCEDSDKTRREKQGIGESSGRKGFKKRKSDKKGQSLSENSSQNLKKGRSRGPADGRAQDLSPALLVALETMTVEHLYEKDSPPPALPSRGYLLDEGFAAELDNIERKTAETDTESGEESDGYTSMNTTTCYDDISGTLTNQVTSSELGYESHTSLIPKGCYENFTDIKRRPIRDVATLSEQDDEPHTPSIPEKHLYKNFSDTQRCIALSEEKCAPMHYDNFVPTSTIALSEQEDTPPIPKRTFKNNTRGSLAHTTLETECLPPLPERHYDNFVDTEVLSEQETAPPIPKRPSKNDTTHKTPETDCNLPPVLERHKNFTDTKRRPTVQEDESRTPPIPNRCYENIFDTKGYPTLDAATESQEESESYVPLIPGRHYDNGPDEDAYINQDDALDASRAGGYVVSEEGGNKIHHGSGSESDEYDYVLPDAVRSARRRVGWCKARAAKAGKN